ncbi:hypothetical protein [Kribbella solani]|uniref:Uncharacterized protein n=1 Tax=Kribbella solani TaxID=236067 RepID=A0A841E4W8_9ACTN|nr:hypothetical protein [Kribbella solani]MBB5983970.1 hypothetical protein [Kribbella solani]
MSNQTVYVLTIHEPDTSGTTFTTTAYTNPEAAEQDAATWRQIDQNQGKNTTYRVVPLELVDHAKWKPAPDGKSGVPNK